MRADIITQREALEAIEPRWWDLFARVPQATPFASPAWLLPWWRSFAPGVLFVIAVSDGDQLIALAPLYIETSPHGQRLLPLGIGLTDILDILLDPAHAVAAGMAIGQVLQAERTRFDCWSADQAPPASGVLTLVDPEGWRSHITPQDTCPVLPLPPSGSLRAVIPARQWRKWQMAQNRAARRSWAIKATTRETLSSDLEHLFRLHAARWQDRSEAGVLAEGVVQGFHDDAAPKLLAAGLLRLTTLWIDGAVAGVYYGLHRGRESFAYLGGFDPAYAFESPGSLLIGAAVETAANAGACRFNFLRGQEPYKYAWGAQDRWNQRRLFEPIR